MKIVLDKFKKWDKMTCETEMHIHFVMTAKDLLKQASIEIEKVKKLNLLNLAMENLDKAYAYGAPIETLRELRLLINNRFMEIVDEQ